MACFHPTVAWKLPVGYSKNYERNGKNFSSRITFTPPRPGGIPAEEIQIPCGRCVGCKLSHSRQWAMRICSELDYCDFAYFFTLTYRDEDLPAKKSLQQKDVTDFLKRLRSKYEKFIKFRYFYCGEYGGRTERPHYHLILFGTFLGDHTFKSSGFLSDKEIVGRSQEGFPLYESKVFSKIWSHGYAPFGAVTYESAAYVARYTLKKIPDFDYGGRKPEFVCMSRRPGIGSQFFNDYYASIYSHDFLTQKGKKLKPPKYFDKLYKELCPEQYESIKERRLEKIRQFESELTPERLKVRELVQQSKLVALPRNYERNN